jgi:hypothetical protein
VGRGGEPIVGGKIPHNTGFIAQKTGIQGIWNTVKIVEP